MNKIVFFYGYNQNNCFKCTILKTGMHNLILSENNTFFDLSRMWC